MNTKGPTLIATFVGLFCALAYSAQAQISPEMAQADVPAFEKLDRNEDSVIQPEEAKGTWLETKFTEVDANRDGYVTKTEYEQATG